MTGFIQLKPSGNDKKWYMVFTYEDELGNRKQRAECTGLVERGNKKKAKEMLEKRLAELEHLAPEVIQQKSTFFLDFMQDWLTQIMPLEIRASTLKQYQQTFDRDIATFKPFQKVPLDKLTPAMIQAYIKTKSDAGLSAKTIRKHWTNINKCLTNALQQNLILFNPAQRVTLPKLKRYCGARALSVTELQHLVKVFKDDPLEAVITLTVNYGLRRSEVLGLCWDAVDFETKQIHIRDTAIKLDGIVIYSEETKTHSSTRTIPLSPNMEDYLKSLKDKSKQWRKECGQAFQENEPVCIKMHSKYGLCGIHPDFCSSHFKRMADLHELNCRFHDLRHSVVNMLRLGGCDAKKISGFIGHSDVSTTLSIYSHLFKDEMNEMSVIIDTLLSKESA